MNTTNTNIKALISLAIGGFGIGLTEFVIMGILPDVASAMQISIPKAGHFIAAYALGVVVGAPLLAKFGSKLPAHRILIYLMIWFTLFNTISGLSGGYWSLLLFRFLSGLPHGAFFGIGAVVAGKLARPGKSAQAIAAMFSGLTIANVIGVPIGTFIGHNYHWSASFFMVGLVGLLTLLSLKYWMPYMAADRPSEASSQHKGLKNMELWALILLTTIGTGGFFAWYSYIAPLITKVAGHPESMVGYAMILAGLGMVLGNFLGAKMAEWFQPLKAVAISLSAMASVLVLNSFLAFNPIAVLVLTFVIGAISFTVAAPLQMAIINTSKGSEMLGSSMNQSAFNLGNASGAYFAGLPLALGYGYTSAGLVGSFLAGAGVIMAISLIIVRKRKQQRKSKRGLAFNT